MAFPQTPLPVEVWIAPGADPAGDPGLWTWEEITDDVRVADGIKIEAGRGDEAEQVDASKCVMSIDNRSGDYAPRNPTGRWYGLLSKNTPLQVRLERGLDTFARVRASGWGPSNNGQNWFHSSTSTWTVDGVKGIQTKASPNTADFAILGGANGRDVDLLYECSMPVMVTGGPMVTSAVLRYTNNINNCYRVFTEFHPAGQLKILMAKSVDSVYTVIDQLILPATWAANDKIWTRVQADGPTLRARVWKDGSPEPTTWQLVTNEATELRGTGVGIYVWRQSSNTNVGALSMYFHYFSTVVNMFTGTVSEWPIRWDQSANDCVSPIEASGIIRRLQQGKAALRSPMYRQLSGYNPAGYWPLEDGSEATSAGTAAINGASAKIVDVEFGQDDAPPGASTSAKLTSNGARIYSRLLRPTGSGFACMFLTKFAALPAAKQILIDFVGSGTVKTWRIYFDNTGPWVEGVDINGSVLTGGAGPIYVVDPTKWVAWQLEAVQVGGNISWSFLWHQVGTQTFYAYTGTEPGTVGQITNFAAYGSTQLLNISMSHIWIGADTLPFVDNTFSLVSNGYAGELAADRVKRLCNENGVRVYIEAGESEPLGRQRVATFLESLRSCETADGGVLSESGAGLAYRPFGARLNVPSEGGLDFALGHIAEPPEPTDDDQRVRNDITVSRVQGGEVRAADEAHIALNGTYDDSVDVNVFSDDQLDDIAGWRLHLGTWNELRWPHIALDLARNSSQVGRWFSMMRIGARFPIINPPSQVEGDELDLLVEGYSQTLSWYAWDVDINCSPARAWDVAVTDNSDWRVDTIGSTVAAAVNTSATSISVASTDQWLWTTDPAEFPFDVSIGGERCTVTAITGASSPQTFTVTRSVNGIFMSHPIGHDVTLWTAAHVSL